MKKQKKLSILGLTITIILVLLLGIVIAVATNNQVNNLFGFRKVIAGEEKNNLDELIIITFKDQKMYEAMKTALYNQYEACSDGDLALYMTKEEINNVKTLDLSGKNITKIDGIEYFTNLGKGLTPNGNAYQLNLSNNNITNIVPLSKLTNLGSISLANNNINNISPLNKITGLTYLNLNSNKIGDISKISNLDLMSFQMKNNVLEVRTTEDTAIVPTIFVDAKTSNSLIYTNENIQVTNGNLTGANARFQLANGKTEGTAKIIGGNADGTTITVKKVSEINHTIKFEDKNLYEAIVDLLKDDDEFMGCSDSDNKIFITDRGVSNLIILDLSNKGIKDLSGLENFKNLSKLNLSNNEITNIYPLEDLYFLTELDLSNNKVDDLSQLDSLRYIDTNKLNIGNNEIVYEYADGEIILPDIFKEAHTQGSKIYTDKPFKYTGCEIVNGNELKVKLKDGVDTATVVIDGGSANGTTLTITRATVAVTGVEINKSSLTLEKGKTEKLTATVSPTNATNKNVTWSSSNTSVATVSSEGLVTAVAPGTAVITVTTASGNKTAKCNVTVTDVTVAVTGVTLNKASLTLGKGKTERLTATVSPTNATNKNVTWSSSNTAIATVNSEGSVAGVAPGTAEITVKTVSGNKTAKCNVTVTEGEPEPENLKNVKFNNRNFYQTMVEKLEGKYYSIDDENYIIKITQEKIDEFTNELGVNYYLELINKNISDFTGIEYFTHLKALWIEDGYIKDYSKIGELKDLVALTICSDYISDLSYFKNLENLMALGLEGNKITNLRPLNSSNKMTNLEVLSLVCENLSDISPLATGYTNLKELYLIGCSISDISPLDSIDYEVFDCRYQVLKCSEEINGTSLPQIFVAAKTPGSKVYTEEEFTYSGCSPINGDKLKVKLNNGVETATVTINGGNADGTVLTIYAPKAITFEDQKLYEEIVNALGDKIKAKNDQTLTIQISDYDVENVKSISLNQVGIKNITGIEKFTNLESLRFKDGNGKINNLNVLTQLAKLKILSLNGCEIEDEDLEIIAQIKTLQTLNLASNHIKDINPLSKLTEISLNTTDFGRLTYLDLSNNNIEDISPISNEEIGMGNLKTLIVDNNKISKIGITGVLINISAKNQTLEITTNKKIVALPDIFREVKNGIIQEGLNFSTVQFQYTNCRLKNDYYVELFDGKTTAEVKIIGGMADGTTFTINYEDYPDVDVTDIILDAETLELNKGDSVKLEATILPENATNKNITWSSSDNKVVKVNSSGTVTAIKEGKAIITVKAEDSDITATCKVKVIDPNINTGVKSVKLNKTETTIGKGQTEKLEATVLPENATNKNVTWSSSNRDVAIVDQNGYVKGINPGTARITVRTVDHGFKAICNVTVINSQDIFVTGVSLNKEETTLEKGQTEKLVATVLPENATNKHVLWSTSNVDIVSVDGGGNITGEKVGTATITARTEDGEFKATCQVTVTEASVIRVEGVTLNKIEISLKKGAEETLIPTVSPENATNKNVTWSSSNINIATVDENGKVKAVSKGIAVITVKTVDGKFKATCQVTVTDEEVPPDVDPDILVNGSKYSIKDGYLNGIKSNTTLETLRENINPKYIIKVIKKNSTEEVTTGKVGTGMKVEVYKDGSLKETLTIVIKGDINGDGIANGPDAIRLLKHRKHKITLEGVEFLAADINGDGVANGPDAIRLLKHRKHKEGYEL